MKKINDIKSIENALGIKIKKEDSENLEKEENEKIPSIKFKNENIQDYNDERNNCVQAENNKEDYKEDHKEEYIERDYEYLKEFDKNKTKMMRYIMYKKRTENEVRTKFKGQISQDMLEDIIEYLKKAGYINDQDYIDRAIMEFKNLKNLSIREIIYKLYNKGLSKNVVEEYMEKHIEELEEYEKRSAENIILKKKNQMEKQDIMNYLLRKGYKKENIKFDE